MTHPVTNAVTTTLEEIPEVSKDLIPAVTRSVTSRDGIIPCPHCGHPMVADEVARALPKVQRRIYEAIRNAGSAGISWSDIMAKVYSDDPTGGPATNSVSVLICSRINPALEKRGLKLVSNGGPGSLYRLVKLP